MTTDEQPKTKRSILFILAGAFQLSTILVNYEGIITCFTELSNIATNGFLGVVFIGFVWLHFLVFLGTTIISGLQLTLKNKFSKLGVISLITQTVPFYGLHGYFFDLHVYVKPLIRLRFGGHSTFNGMTGLYIEIVPLILLFFLYNKSRELAAG